MVLSSRHEAIKRVLELLVDVISEEKQIDAYGYGSTTFRRETLARGFEPDACYYFENDALAGGKEQLDLSIDPAPDLVIRS